ncbi:MAG: TRAP transporter small permease subunit, partial [Reyranella sp.]|nr:TRAP transporter small permease subunit [Reyranella sp.]
MIGVRRFAQWGLWFGGALVLLAAVLIGIDVLMRKFLALSIGGADELAGYSLAIGTTWGLGAALLDRAHIRID